MRIAYAITRADQGGAQTKVLALARHGMSSGHDVRVITGERGWLTDMAGEAGIETVILPSLARSWNPLRVLSLIGETKRVFRERPADILHMHSSNTLFMTCALGGLGKDAPAPIATACGLSVMNPGWDGSALVRRVYDTVVSRLWKRCERVIFVCRSDLEYATGKGFIGSDKARMVYNGLPDELSFMERNEAREAMGAGPGDDIFIVGTVARLDRQKDIDLFIDTAAHPDADGMRFVAVGGGPEHDRLRQRIADERLTGRCVILDRPKDAYGYMSGFDVFVLTSRYEGFPWTLLEASRAKLPIVSVDVGGCGEVVIDGQTGMLSRERTPSALAGAVRRLRDDPALRGRFGTAAEERARQMFMRDVLTRGTYDVYDELKSDAIP
jgi:glycosyltransferase involved in cell wall biosynthesis